MEPMSLAKSDNQLPRHIGPGTLVKLRQFVDERGALTVTEVDDTLPFEPRRVFVISDVPVGAERGGHANRNTHELLICVSGEFTVTVDQGRETSEVTLCDPTTGLHIPPMVWVRLHSASVGAILVVVASNRYDSTDPIHDRLEFERLVAER